MELRQMEYFVTVIKFRNYTKAANELHVSQPTISIAIQKLEEELGVRLLERDNKSLSLTEEGEIFLEKCKEILQKTEDLSHIMSDLRPSAKKKLSMAFPSTAGSWLWGILINEFPKEYPNIELTLIDYGTLEIVRKLKFQELEVGYGVIDLVRDPEIEHDIIRRGQLKLIVPKGHPLAKMTMVPVSLLKEERILMYQRGTSYTEKLLHTAMKEEGIDPRFWYVREQSTVFDLVSQGLGIAAVLDDHVSTISNNSEICVKEFDREITYEAGLLWSKNKFLSSSARKLIKFVGNYRDRL